MHMKTHKLVTFMAVVATFGAVSTSAHAGGLIADILRPVIGNQAANELDRKHAEVKNAIPAYKAIEESGSAAARTAAAGAALYYGGPVGLVAGQAALGAVNNGLNQLGQQYDNRQAQQTHNWQAQVAYCNSHGFANYDPHTNQCFAPHHQGAHLYSQAQQIDPYQWQRSFCNARGFRNYSPYNNMCIN